MELSSLLKTYEFKAPSFALRDASTLVPSGEEIQAKKNEARFAQSDAWWASAAGEKDRVTLLFAGDLLCQEGIIEACREGDSYDFSACFAALRPLFKAADFVAGNLETPVSASSPYRGEILTHEGPFYCNAPVPYLEALRQAGFDMLTTANNHTLDAGVRGLLETIVGVEDHGMIQTGTFKNGDVPKYVLVDVCGFKVGFTAFGLKYNLMDENLRKAGKADLLNTYSEEAAEEILRAMKAAGAEYTVCFPHWGKEFTSEIDSEQLEMARHLTKAGYDLVLGSHSHVVQRHVNLNKKPVLFSLGNLLSHLNLLESQARMSQYPVLCQMVLSRSEDGVSADVKYIPCKIEKDLEGLPPVVLPLIPEAAYGEAAEAEIREGRAVIAEMLGTPEGMLEGNPGIDAAAYAQAKPFLDALNAAIDAREASRRPVSKPAGKSAKGEPPAAADDKLVLDGLYYEKTGADTLRMVSLQSKAYVVRMPKAVKGMKVTSVAGDGAPNSVTRLVYLPALAQTVEEGAFANYELLESARLYDGLRSIGPRAFENCPTLMGICCPRSLASIGPRAFAGCANLRSIKIPPRTKDIAEDAFEGCENLVIYAQKDTSAHAYAKKHGIPFVSMPIGRRSSAALKDAALSGRTPVLKADAHVPSVRMGKMQGARDSHPAPILAACEALHAPLPPYALCGLQPSWYLGATRFSGDLDSIERILGERIAHIDPSDLERRYRQFASKFKTQENLLFTKTDFTVYFADYLLHAYDYGYSPTNYFDFELYNKEAKERDTFLNTGFRERVFASCNDRSALHFFNNKAEFNTRFAPWVNRDWLDLTKATREEYRAFVAKHPVFFLKPLGGHGGQGARVVDSTGLDLDDLYVELDLERVVIEEIISQHATLAEFNASTLNTVRLVTLLTADDNVEILLTVARFGRAGNVVDNFHGGGVGAIVDIETGRICTQAINRAHVRSSVHPDSGKAILGFQYPEWERIKEAVTQAARLVPEVRHVGWDVAVLEDGSIEFVEGNCASGYDVLQSPDQLGRRSRYYPFLPQIEKLNGVQAEEYPSVKVSLGRKPAGQLARSVIGVLFYRLQKIRARQKA